MAQGIHFAVGAAIFGELTESDIACTAAFGFPGIEATGGFDTQRRGDVGRRARVCVRDLGIRAVVGQHMLMMPAARPRQYLPGWLPRRAVRPFAPRHARWRAACGARCRRMSA